MDIISSKFSFAYHDTRRTFKYSKEKYNLMLFQMLQQSNNRKVYSETSVRVLLGYRVLWYILDLFSENHVVYLPKKFQACYRDVFSVEKL